MPGLLAPTHPEPGGQSQPVMHVVLPMGGQPPAHDVCVEPEPEPGQQQICAGMHCLLAAQPIVKTAPASLAGVHEAVNPAPASGRQ